MEIADNFKGRINEQPLNCWKVSGSRQSKDSQK